MRNRGLKTTKRNLYIRHFPTALDACALFLLLLLDVLLLLGHLVHPLGLGHNALPNRAVCTSIIQAWRFLVLRLISLPRPPCPGSQKRPRTPPRPGQSLPLPTNGHSYYRRCDYYKLHQCLNLQKEHFALHKVLRKVTTTKGTVTTKGPMS